MRGLLFWLVPVGAVQAQGFDPETPDFDPRTELESLGVQFGHVTETSPCSSAVREYRTLTYGMSREAEQRT